MSLIKINGECFAAKNVHFLSLCHIKGENFAVKTDMLCFTLCFTEGCLIVRVLFLSLIKVKGKHFAVKIDGLCFTLRFVKG